ncbi:MAG: DUF6875 domain-containing protein [Rhizobiaceae bacterium]
MLDTTAAGNAVSSAPRLTMEETRQGAWADDAAMNVLRGWVESYLMRGHADLGRTGAVCPFTKQAAKIDTVRLAISRAGADDEEEAFALIRRCFSELEQIPCKPGMELFRTIIVGFPECSDAAGMKMLERVQRRHKFYSLSRFRMIGYMFAGSEAPGLWNQEFRPLRAPLPVLAIRHLVEQDAPFAARHKLLMAPYLLKFRLAGLKRILEYRRRP